MLEVEKLGMTINTKSWYTTFTTLPPYKTCFFGMTVIHNQLVLVGGMEVGGAYCTSTASGMG